MFIEVFHPLFCEPNSHINVLLSTTSGSGEEERYSTPDDKKSFTIIFSAGFGPSLPTCRVYAKRLPEYTGSDESFL